MLSNMENVESALLSLLGSKRCGNKVTIPRLRREEISLALAINTYFDNLTIARKSFAASVLDIAKEIGVVEFKRFANDRCENVLEEFRKEFAKKIYVYKSLQTLQTLHKGDDKTYQQEIMRHLSALEPEDDQVLPLGHIHPQLKQHNSHNMERLELHVSDLLIITKSIANNLKTVDYINSVAPNTNNNAYRLCVEILATADKDKTIAKKIKEAKRTADLLKLQEEEEVKLAEVVKRRTEASKRRLIAIDKRHDATATQEVVESTPKRRKTGMCK